MITKTTQLAEATAQLGITKPVAYGYVRARGNVLVQNTQSDGSIIAIIGLGEGEWDGVDRFWIRGKIINTADTTIFHFHPGTQGVIGSGLTPSSNGGDQNVDNFISLLPVNVYRITYSGLAYVAIRAFPDPAAPNGGTFDWMGDYRSMKVRIFDNAGNQTGYAFSTNPAWIMLDLLIRTMLKPEGMANEALTAAEKTRIDFASFKTAADYYDVDIGGGIKRFEASIAFPTATSLGDALNQLKLMSRSYLLEYDGQIHLFADQSRSSTFAMTRDHIVEEFKPDKTQLRAAANHIIGQFNDLNPMKSADITSIVRASGISTVQTTQAHPFLVGDTIIQVNVLDNSFNVVATITAVPDSTHYQYADTGGATSTTGGYVGTAESRFQQRTVIVDHEQHQQAVGQRGVGIASTFKRNTITLDFGNNTAERVSRLLKYVKYRTLGDDSQATYKAPKGGTIRCSYTAVDANNKALAQQVSGDVVTLDTTVSQEWAGDYEIMDHQYNPPEDKDSSATIDLTLKEFMPLAFTDTADTPQDPFTTRPAFPPKTAPSAPTVTQNATPIFGGIMFKFNQVITTDDSIFAYKIYRNTTNNFGTATLLDTVSHDPLNNGTALTYQDTSVTATGTFHYWVTAVSKYGLESSSSYASSNMGSFAVPVETLNLIANPQLSGSGNLPAVSNAPAQQETWQQVTTPGTVPTFRNNREIKISAAATPTIIGHYKNISRFKDGQIVTWSFRVRRNGNVPSPSGTFTFSINRMDSFGNTITSITTANVNVSTLSTGSYVLYRLTAQLNRVAGQNIWGFLVTLSDTQEDIYITEPMLNNGSDAAPFSINTYLQNVPPYAFEGVNFVADDFTDTNGTAITSHYPTQGGIGPHTGVGGTWVVLLEGGSATGVTTQSSTAQYSSAPLTGVGNVIQVVQAPDTGISTYGASAPQVAYTVSAAVHLGAFTTVTSAEAGLMARWTDINNFYLARLLTNGSGTFAVDLFKRVAGAYTSLGTFNPGSTNDLNIDLQVTDGAKVVFVNGTSRISSGDNVLAGPGQAGFRLGLAGTVVTTRPSVSAFKAFPVQNVASPSSVPTSSPSTAPPSITYDPNTEPGRVGGGVKL